MMHRALLIAVGALALTVIQASLAVLVPPGPPPDSSAAWLVLVSNAMTAAVLIELAGRIAGSRTRRAATLWLMWGSLTVNALVEAGLFDIGITSRDLVRLALYMLAVAAAFALVVAWIRTSATTPASTPLPVQTRMLALAPPLYVALYFSAGTLVWPYIDTFYSAHPLPAGTVVAAVQVIRGLGFGLTVLLLARTLRATRLELVTLAGLTLSVLGGVAPLLVPNPYLPTHVRLAHLPEVGVSNLIFGAVLAWVLTARARAVRAAATAYTLRSRHVASDGGRIDGPTRSG